MDELHRGGERTAGAVLRAGLADASELAGDLDEAASLGDILADRFLDVGVLARLHRPDSAEGMPVVRGGDENGVDRRVVTNDAEILDLLRHGTFQLAGEQRGDFVGAVEIGIADVGDVAVREVGEFAGVGLATDAAADDRDGEFFVGADGGRLFLREQLGWQCGGGGGHDGFLEEAAAAQVFHGFVRVRSVR